MKLVYLFFGFLFIGTTFGKTSKDEDILKKLKKFTIVYPEQYDGEQIRSKRQVNTLIHEDLGAHKHSASFRIQLNDKREIILDLSLNKELVPSSFGRTQHTSEGLSTVEVKEKDFHHCNYHGLVRGEVGSRVTVSTCKGISGTFTTGNETLHIRPIDVETSKHVIYRESDMSRDEDSNGNREIAHACMSLLQQKISFNETEPITSDGVTVERRRRAASRGRTWSYVEMLVVVNQDKAASFDNDDDEVLEHVKAIVHLVDGKFKQIKVRVVLAHLEIWRKDPIAISGSSTEALHTFRDYGITRSEGGRVQDLPWKRADNIELIIGEDFDVTQTESGPVKTLGIAFTGNMCTEGSVGIIVDNGKLRTKEAVAATLTHELGHSFGCRHDEQLNVVNNNRCACVDGYDEETNASRCIMATQTTLVVCCLFVSL